MAHTVALLAPLQQLPETETDVAQCTGAHRTKVFPALLQDVGVSCATSCISLRMRNPAETKLRPQRRALDDDGRWHVGGLRGCAPASGPPCHHQIADHCPRRSRQAPCPDTPSACVEQSELHGQRWAAHSGATASSSEAGVSEGPLSTPPVPTRDLLWVCSRSARVADNCYSEQHATHYAS